MTTYDASYAELDKLDDFLGLPRGTTRSALSLHQREFVPLLNERLARHGLRLDDDTAVAVDCRAAWAELMKRLGISNAWWFDGNPSRLPPAPITDLLWD